MNIEQGWKLLRSMQSDLAANRAAGFGWSPSDLRVLCDHWGMNEYELTPDAVLRYHPDHPDLELVISIHQDPIGKAKLTQAVRCMEELRGRLVCEA